MCLAFVFFLIIPLPTRSTRTDTHVPYTTLVRSLIGFVDTVLAVDRVEAEKALQRLDAERDKLLREQSRLLQAHYADAIPLELLKSEQERIDRKSTRLNSSH